MRVARTVTLAMGMLVAGTSTTMAAQETRLNASHETAIRGGSWRVAMNERVRRGNPSLAWKRQSEIYWSGSTYARWQQKVDGQKRLPYGICFLDTYTAVFTYANALTGVWFYNHLGSDTTDLGTKRSSDGKVHTWRLRTCVTSEFSVHTTRGRAVRKRIADKITFSGGGGGGVIVTP